MVEMGIGAVVSTCLERTVAVPKAAFVSGEERPTAERHFETIAVRRRLGEFRRVVIVDDVVTRGATLLGAASRLLEVYPAVDVRGFAAIRTISDPADFQAIVDPVLGRIEFRDGETYRRP
jgi:predicted amidophosphoribosyltransferase